MSQTSYAVCHLERGRANGSGLSCHIERQTAQGKSHIPENADAALTHLNQELIDFPEGVPTRTRAIQYRIDHAGLQRKVGKNQTTHVCIMLTGSHDQMMKLSEEGRIGQWCESNLKWLKDTFGSDNVVSCVLHMDEKTPHLHATVVPIVDSPRKRRKREGEAKYKIKPQGPRLCCDEVMSCAILKKYQDTYGAAMKPFGLERGIVESEAKHVATSKYYKEKAIALQSEIDSKEKELEEKSHGFKAKVLNVFGSGELAESQKAIEEGKEEISRLKQKIATMESEKAVLKQTTDKRVFDIDQFCKSIQQENEELRKESRKMSGIIKRQSLQLQAERQPDKHLLTDLDLHAIGQRGDHYRLDGRYANVPFSLSLTSEMDRARDLGLNAFEIAASFLPEIFSTCFDVDRELAEQPEVRHSIVQAFFQLVDDATTPTESMGGGGGSSQDGWRDKDKDDVLKQMFQKACTRFSTRQLRRSR